MLTDRYELPLSTASSAARDAYVEGCAAKLTMYPGAIEAFDRAIVADPGFALVHAARAHVLLERGDAVAARASIAAAKALIPGLTAREASHVAFFDVLIAGDAEAAVELLGRRHPGAAVIGSVTDRAGTVELPGAGLVGREGGFSDA